MRTTAGSVGRATTSPGITRCLQSPVPEMGSQFRFTPRMRISMMPSQKSGMACPMAATVRAVRSIQVPFLSAESAPSGPPTASEMASPTAPSLMVSSAFSNTKSNAGRACRNESPKLPRTARPTNLTYWTGKGSSSPSFWRRFSRTSSSASGGSSAAVGSPVSSSSPCTTNSTPSRTRMLCSIRRTRNFSIGA